MKWPGIILIVMLAGCASDDAGEDVAIKPGWPSLAPRAGEVSPLVPRVPAGACAGCNSGPAVVVTPALADLPAPVRAVLPADAEARLASIETAVAAVEAAWPRALDAARAAVRNAPAGARDTEADVQASRFEALFQSLGAQDAALAALEPVLAEAEGGDTLNGRAADLRARLDALDDARKNSLN